MQAPIFKQVIETWQSVLKPSGATLSEGRLVQFPGTHHELCDAMVFPLPQYDLLELTGPDSKKFLQGQTTCDVDALDATNWTPGAICDPRGRMITSFDLYQPVSDTLWLHMNRDLAQPTLDAIQKYSVFFKTDLCDASDRHTAVGLVGKGAADLVKSALGIEFDEKRPANAAIYQDDILAARYPGDRIKLIFPLEKTERLWQALAQSANPADSDRWELLDIQQGIGNVSAATAGEFLPQMLNLQARNGISFRKGCYTGQEVVARTKYRGKLKRRTYLIQFDSEQLPPPGSACFVGGTDVTGDAQSQGIVVNAAVASGTRIEALAVLSDQLAEQTAIAISVGDESPIDTEFEILPLPYPLDS